MIAALPDRLPEARHHLEAFGLAIECDWELPGSRPARHRPSSVVPTVVRTLSSRQIDDAWAQPATRIYEPIYPNGRVSFTVDESRDGYRLWFEQFGRYLVSRDGTEIGCERSAVTRDRQTRFLFAQVFPLVAVLHGYELLHASAVAGAYGVAAFVGPSGAGKTSVASRLVLRGADLVTDDVLALELSGSGLTVCPGPPFMAVPAHDQRLIADADGRLGPEVGSSDKLHASPRTTGRGIRLRALYHLAPGPRITVASLRRGELGSALRSGFAPYLATPARLLRHLEVAHRLSTTVDQFEVEKPRDAPVEEVVETIERHLRGLAGLRG